MKTPRITQKEQSAIRKRAKNELERLEKILDNEQTAEVLDSFKNKFNICESVYKIILSKYLIVKDGVSPERIHINLSQAKSALRFAGYDFRDELIDEIFGLKSKKGKGFKTVKKLRDEITHSLKQSAVNEIISRQEELFGYMNDFLNVVKNFDTVATIT